MEIKVLLFGELVQIAGANEIALKDVSTTQDASEKLFVQFPAFRTKKYALAVNKQLVKESHTLMDGDELALLPPFSGG